MIHALGIAFCVLIGLFFGLAFLAIGIAGLRDVFAPDQDQSPS